jgi:hypothetical protein
MRSAIFPEKKRMGLRIGDMALVPPMFAQDVGGIGLAREVHHQDIL